MNWYITKIVFRIITGNSKTAQFDEQLRLVEADNENEAFQKAQAIGLKEEETFVNEHNTPVKWKFINVAEIQHLKNVSDGIELYSRTEEHEDGDRYATTINQRARAIQMKSLLQVLQVF